jgi:polar amino acid transport system substrate-binding protein
MSPVKPIEPVRRARRAGVEPGGRNTAGARARLAASAAALGLGLCAALSSCSSGLVTVGAHPTAPPVQPGSVVTGTPAPAATGSAGDCNPEASSKAPTAADSSGPTLQKIRARGKLIVGVSDDGYLTGFLDPTNHQEEGFDVDIAEQVAQAIFGSADNHIQFVAVTNPERITDITGTPATQTAPAVAPSIDMTVDTMTITCQRLTQVGFSSVYYQAQQRLLVLKNSGITSMQQLAGQKVCAASSSTSIQTIQDSASHPLAYGVVDFSDCLVALQQNQVSAVSTDDTILAGLAQQDPNTEVVGPSLESEPYGIAVSLKAPDLEGFINGVLAQIRSNGVWESIYNKWLGPYLGAAQPPVAHYSD